jgi:hypothetical protein
MEAKTIEAFKHWIANCRVELEANLAAYVYRTNDPKWMAMTDGSLQKFPQSFIYNTGAFAGSLFGGNKAWAAVAAMAKSDKYLQQHLDQMVGSKSTGSVRLVIESIGYQLLPELKVDTSGTLFLDYSNNEKNLDMIVRLLTGQEVTLNKHWLIQGLAAETDVDLTNGLLFRRLTSDEKANFLNQCVPYKIYANHIPEAQCDWFGLCFSLKMPKVIGDAETNEEYVGPAELQPQLEKFLLSVALLGPEFCKIPSGNVDVPSLQFASALSLGQYVTFGRDPMIAWTLTSTDRVVIRIDQAKAILDCWNIIRPNANPKLRPNLENALHRYLLSETRNSKNDKLVDLMIAVESLYGDSKNTTELSFRMSLRASQFAEGNRERKQQIHKSFRKAYELRSAVVHGKRPAEQDIEKCIDEIRPVIAAGLLKALKLAKNGEIDWDSYLF